MYAFMVNKLSGEEQKDSFAKAAKDIAVMRAGLVVNQLVLYLLGLLGPLLGGLVTIALPFVLIIVILYNDPFGSLSTTIAGRGYGTKRISGVLPGI